jgi:hypothetical protein
MWRHAHNSRERRAEALGRQLVLECEGFLAGRYPGILQDHGLPVPEWAWLSVLAHAPASALEARAVGGLRHRPVDRATAQWSEAVALLARELVITASRTGRPVEELQHTIIVDVELRAAGSEPPAERAGPTRLVDDVRRAIARFRGTTHRS